MEKQKSFQGKPIHTISRGKRYEVASKEDIESLKKISEKLCGSDTCKLKEIIKLQNPQKESSSFSGASSAITFKASKEIQLCGLCFFGPVVPAQSTFFNVWIGMETIHGTIENIMDFKTSVQVVPSSDEDDTFWIYFREPALLQGSVYYRLAFELTGPKTGFMDPRSAKTTIYGENNIIFEFLPGSSKQIQELAYVVPEKNL